MTRTRWTPLFPANTACSGDPSQAQDWLCPSEPLSQQHWRCCFIPCSQASSKYWNAFPHNQLDLPRDCSALCCPIQITVTYPLSWLQTQNRLKGEGRFSCVPWCSALLHPFYEMQRGGSLAVLIRRPKGHHVLPALLDITPQDQLWSLCFWAVLSFPRAQPCQSINLPAAVEWNRTPNPALVWVHTLSGN